MYGQIHCVVRELVLVKFGEEQWESILKKSELDEDKHFLVFSQFDDALTMKLVGAVSECLGIPVSAVLEVFGDYFLVYCLKHGYDKMLKTLGSNIWNFIQNLDSLHSLLALSYKNIVPPSFRCETGDDDDLLLHYYTVRPGLYPIVIGLVRAVGRDIFNQNVDISVLDRNTETIGGKIQEHTVFKVVTSEGDKGKEGGKCPVERFEPEGEEDVGVCVDICPMMSSSPSNFQLNAKQFCSAFPYHIIFDSDLKIKQCGMKIKQFAVKLSQSEELNMEELFTIIHPNMSLSIENIRSFINSVFFISVNTGSEKNTNLILKGQMMWLEETTSMMFLGSPRITSLNELMEMDVYLSDIPLYDVTRELVLLNQQRIAEIDIAKKLDETTTELKKTSKALESEKKKTDELLYQMLPKKVANSLKNGQTVEAEKFEQVTILFSDIVTFTTLSAACTPLQIVNLLNNLYQRFDKLTSYHGVYKVETIGDAYMVVCGVPEKTTLHASPIAQFAIDMVQEASRVTSPHTNKPIQIRVGIHTGPVVAGVVGVKMPRYCLFGDTVNTASRMESHGKPGRIHVSPTTFHHLRNSHFLIKKRGEIHVKGKGNMTTYFLVGEFSLMVEPKDEFDDLPVIETKKQQNTGSKVVYGHMDPSLNQSKTCRIL